MDAADTRSNRRIPCSFASQVGEMDEGKVGSEEGDVVCGGGSRES